MALTPDTDNEKCSEDNVVPVGLNRGRGCYDLVLYGEKGASSDRGVLKVTVQLCYDFVDGALEWTDDLEATFKGRVAANCEFRWGEVWRIKSTSPVSGKISDIGVIFNVESVFFSLDAHYNVTVKGVRGRSPVSETVPGKGTAKWDSLDVNPNSIKKYKDQEFYQMGAVHEFGHMLGLYDEYYGSSDDPMPWQDDPGSMMHTGMGTRPRHYVPFAGWLNKNYKDAGTFKVYEDGASDPWWDASRAKLLGNT